MQPPRFLFVHLSESCNLKCQHCLYWQPIVSGTRKGFPNPLAMIRDELSSSAPHAMPDNPDNITVDRKLAIAAEFAELNPRGVVVTCGAESTMDLEGFFRFTMGCRALGLRIVSVTNGVKVSTPEKASRMVADGPTELSLSIDSHLEGLHDEMRGVRGSFKAVTKAIRLMLAARRDLGLGADRKIHAMVLLCSLNYLDLEDTFEFALKELGADKLKINMLQPTFGCSTGVDEFFEKHSTMDGDRLMEILRRCNARYGLGYNPAWISQVGMYAKSVARAPEAGRGWQNPIRTSEQICNSGERNMVVDMRGIVRLCVSEIFPGIAWQSHGDLRSFWEGGDAIREKMSTCKQLCGITHSMRRLSSTFAGATHFE